MIVLLSCVFLLALFAYQKAYGDELGRLSYESLPDKPGSGELFFRQERGEDKRYRPAVHLASEVEVVVNGLIASVNLSQQFKNDSKHWVEATYVLPLPETAAVDAMQFRVGSRLIKGEIKEKNRAQKIYSQARRSGKKAALIVQQRPNLFTQKVANIAPGETIELELHYQQKVDYQKGEFIWRMPLTLTPRFIPGRALSSLKTVGGGWAVPTDQVPDADKITPPMTTLAGLHAERKNPIKIDVKLRAGLPLEGVVSGYHKVLIKKDAGQHHITLAAGSVPMDRDFELRWKPVANQQPAGAVFTEEFDGEHFALLMIVPPEIRNDGDQDPMRLSRELMFIIDTSGSMGGDSIRQAKSSLKLALSRLKPNDRFNIIEFNSRHQSLFPSLEFASEVAITKANKFVGTLKAGGGTQMAPALHDALGQLRGSDADKHIQQLVFITDGSVGNEQTLFNLIEKNLGRARLFTVAIGSAPNSYFMRKAAQFGRGTFSHISVLSELEERMENLFSQLESPVMTALEMHWPGELAVESWPKRLPDLYAGEPLVVNVKLDRAAGSKHKVSLRGKVANEYWQRELPLYHSVQSSGVATLWAREKVSGLLDQKHRGRDSESIRTDVLKLALRHKILSPYTSFVAVEEMISRPDAEELKQKSIPNLLAKGQKPMNVTLPKTATGAPLSLLLSLMFLALALFICHHFPAKEA